MKGRPTFVHLVCQVLWKQIRPKTRMYRTKESDSKAPQIPRRVKQGWLESTKQSRFLQNHDNLCQIYVNCNAKENSVGRS